MSKRRISRTTAAIYAFVLVSMQFATRPASADDDGQKAQADRPPLSILVVKLDARSPVVKRLKSMGFEVQEVQWNTIQPSRLMGVDVILLPTGWAYEKNIYETLDGRHEQFQDFVRRGGGLDLLP